MTAFGEGMSTGQALFATLMIALYLVLNVLILRKAGRSPWWTLLFIFPPAYVAGIWAFAFSRWPRVDSVRVTPPSDYEGGWEVEEKDRREGDQGHDVPREEEERKGRYIAPDPRTRRSWDDRKLDE